MKVPIDASYDVQQSIQEIHDTLRSIENRLSSVVAPGGAARDLSDLQSKVSRMERAPLELDFNDVFRGAGPAHALGYVPDPGEAAWDERTLLESGGWDLPLRGQIRPVTSLGMIGDIRMAGDILQVLGALVMTGNLSAAKAYLKDLEVLGNISGMNESHGGVLVNPNGITATVNVIAWQAPYPCRVALVRGYRVGGSSASINARLNGASNHLSSALSLTSADTWMDGGAVQNQAYVLGDKLEIMLTAVGGSPTQIGVQVVFVRQ